MILCWKELKFNFKNFFPCARPNTEKSVTKNFFQFIILNKKNVTIINRELKRAERIKSIEKKIKLKFSYSHSIVNTRRSAMHCSLSVMCDWYDEKDNKQNNHILYTHLSHSAFIQTYSDLWHSIETQIIVSLKEAYAYIKKSINCDLWKILMNSRAIKICGLMCVLNHKNINNIIWLCY